MSENQSSCPPQLAKFPPEVKAAFDRYTRTGDEEAVQLIVLAALVDFMPKRSAGPMAQPADDQRLIEDLGYDSLAVAETVFFLEDLFNVKIGNQDLLTLQTVGELKKFVTDKLTEPRSVATT